MSNETLMHISPIDGRYQQKTASLQSICSEYGLIYYRVVVEIKWLLFLAKHPDINHIVAFEPEQENLLLQLVDSFNLDDANSIKDIEQQTNHDVKAVEYFLRNRMQQHNFKAIHLASIHFAATSEDINNLAYGLMLKELLSLHIIPNLELIQQNIQNCAREYADVAMLSRTHGQSASPTTMGKEFANVYHRLKRQLTLLKQQDILGKMNGAVGNFNAHFIAYPSCKLA